jgi:protein-L-isoaspartate(D-aspartate) O-methyltransferase
MRYRGGWWIFELMMFNPRGIGLTSQRARDRLVKQLQDMGITSQQVLEAIRTIPRHLFVDEALASRAYENIALPIGFGQTISQPYIVARMTELLTRGEMLGKVLEIGAGCGYQSAILARFAAQVFSIERVAALSARLRQHLSSLHYHNVRVKHGDGALGWPKHAPYDGILVAAAPQRIPRAILDQLNIDGRLIVPVGEPGQQQLVLVSRTHEGYLEERFDQVSFVPMLDGIS